MNLMRNKPTVRDLYVSEIAFEVEEEDLLKLFSLCGKVRSIHMITDPKSGLFRGRAFVHMATAAEAKDAINALDGTRLLNRCISVSAVREKTTEVAAGPAVAEKPKRRERPRRQRK